MNIHHTKHHQTYITNVNAALDKFPELKGLGLEGLNKAVGSDVIPKDVATAVRNNAGGHWCVHASSMRGCICVCVRARDHMPPPA